MKYIIIGKLLALEIDLKNKEIQAFGDRFPPTLEVISE